MFMLTLDPLNAIKCHTDQELNISSIHSAPCSSVKSYRFQNTFWGTEIKKTTTKQGGSLKREAPLYWRLMPACKEVLKQPGPSFGCWVKLEVNRSTTSITAAETLSLQVCTWSSQSTCPLDWVTAASHWT